MDKKQVQRRLAAILAIDVVGYSRLMGEDESGTLSALKSYREEVTDPLISENSGRIVKLMGDGALVEFASVVDAVQCAVVIQNAVSQRHLDNPEKKAISFRIGINIGDILVDSDDIYGDGVNVAARLEPLADPGGITLSGMVYEHVKGKISDVEFENLGSQQLKNIAEPVQVYRVVTASQDPVTEHPTLPDKPSIVVLPFDDMSTGHEDQYFSDGITEDLTTALSHFNWLFVVARNSAFTYKGGSVDVKQIGMELGVRYVLEGSVRRSGNRVRINAQLIDAQVNTHVWAQRFDRMIEDVFELQDDIVASIASTVGPEITSAEIERVRIRRPDRLDAWEHYLQALSYFFRMTQEDIYQAIDHLDSAIGIEPDFASAIALMALCHAHIGLRGWVKPASEAIAKARTYSGKGVKIAPTSPETNHALAFILCMTGEARQAISIAERALELNPNYADAFAVLGHARIFCGDIEGGMDACHQALRSNPRDPRGSWLSDALGHGYFFQGDYEKAIEISEKGLQQDSSVYGNLVTLASAYAQLGNSEKATVYINQLLRYIPRYSLRALSKNPMFVDTDLANKLIESMRLAGLPE